MTDGPTFPKGKSSLAKWIITSFGLVMAKLGEGASPIADLRRTATSIVQRHQPFRVVTVFFSLERFFANR